MKVVALSLRQPWASMVATGGKTIETRVWGTKYRGPLLVCAAREPVGHGPTGCAVALVRLVACRPMLVTDQRRARCKRYPGAVSWLLADAVWLRPEDRLPVRGYRGLFKVEVPDEGAIAAAVRQMRRAGQCT